MIADINITEKSFGPSSLMTRVKFSVDDGEKVGLIGRNGVGKTTLFAILTGQDRDFSGEIIFRRGASVVATAQEHHDLADQSVMDYILAGLPEYQRLSNIINTYPETMGQNLRQITEFSEALERFSSRGYYEIEAVISVELERFQLAGFEKHLMASLSGGQKRIIEVVKVMHSDAHLALIDEPTNHMDYVAKDQFINWMKSAKSAMIIITHDRDVLGQVDRIIELKDGKIFSYKGNYDDYLVQNAVSTTSGMNEYEVTQRQIENLKARIQYARSKKASWGGTADKRNPFVVMEQKALKEIKELQKIEKPNFWIDKQSVANLDYKQSGRYERYKAKNIRMDFKSEQSRSRQVLLSAKNLTVGYDDILFSGLNFELRESQALEIRGRNGSGKTTLIKLLLGRSSASVVEGEAKLDSHIRVGVYEQEISPTYFNLSLHDAVEKLYLSQNLPISETKIRQLLSNYLFLEANLSTPIAQLSGGQKARFQLIALLSGNPQLIILDEPTNHLDLPSIEELETSLEKYSGAILYVSHDNYFRQNLGGQIVNLD